MFSCDLLTNEAGFSDRRFVMSASDGSSASVNPPDSSWMAQVKNWKANHFTISDAEANVPRLLRRVAASIEELGPIEVLDLTFSNQVEGRAFESKVTVYFSFPDQ
jgi:hypothetical protein